MSSAQPQRQAAEAAAKAEMSRMPDEPPGTSTGTEAVDARGSGDAGATGGLAAVLFPLLAPVAGLIAVLAAALVAELQQDGLPDLTVETRQASATEVLSLLGAPSTGVVRFARADLRAGDDARILFPDDGRPGGEKASSLGVPSRSAGRLIASALAAEQEPSKGRQNALPSDVQQQLPPVMLEQQQLQQVARSVLDFWPIAEPTRATEATPGPPRIRLGDAVYGGVSAPGAHVFHAVVGPAGAAVGTGDGDLVLDRQALRTATMGAAIAALLKADDLGLTELVFAQALADDAGVRASEDWSAAVRVAVGRFSAYTSNLTRIRILHDSRPSAPEASGAALDRPGIAMFVQRRLSVRFAVEGIDSLVPLAFDAPGEPFASPNASAGQASGNAPADGAPRQVLLRPQSLAPAHGFGPNTSMLPALAGFSALLVLAAAGALTADRRRQALRPLGEIPLATRAAVVFAVPLALVIYASISWVAGLNWAPDGIARQDFWHMPAAAYAFLVGAGALSGYAWSASAFRPLGTREPPTEREQLRSTLIRDVPIEDWARQDRLGFRNLVLALARFLDNRDTDPPLVLAINGPWGSGKSSVMRMLQNELDGTGRFHFAWFNAWQYREQDQILAAFLRTIGRELSRKHGLGFMARIAWVRLSTASYGQLLKYSSPFLLLLAAYLISDLWGSSAAGDDQAGGDGARTAEDGDWLSLAARVVEYGFTLLGIGGAVELLRWAKPFQKPLSQLLTPPSSSGGSSTLDQFHSEFNLFRKAVGDAKFLIFVDDLDRCPPEAVVEVLKTINLIATCEDGPGKTFFVLGFDWTYILKSIEMHFDRFIGKDADANGRFGREYLKKIVTLPISVPKPSPERLAEFVGALEGGRKPGGGTGDGDPPEEDAGPLARATDGLRRFGRTPFNVVASLVVALTVAVAINHSLQERLSDRAPAAVSLPGTQATGESTNSPAGVEPPGAAVTVTVAPAEPVGAAWSGALGALIAVLGLGAAVLVIVNLIEASRRKVAVPPEPRDSGEFVDAVRGLARMMPANPRDIIRLVNMMRVAHLVQSPAALRPLSTDDPDPGPRDIFSGSPLPAMASTRLTLLYYRWADLLDVDKLENDLIPALDRKQGLQPFIDDPRNGPWAHSLRRALAEIPDGEALFGNPATVRRFIEIYRHLLHVEPVARDDDVEVEEVAAETPAPA
jgi:hypothetical protein